MSRRLPRRSAREPSGNGVRPDFADVEVTDFGQTIRLGPYEAAGDAVLYEFDPEYRRRARKRLLATDNSFGACLRRLRLQKGVRRDDFPGVSEKQIARIERGETGKPRAATLARIAERLGVRAEEIEEYRGCVVVMLGTSLFKNDREMPMRGANEENQESDV